MKLGIVLVLVIVALVVTTAVLNRQTPRQGGDEDAEEQPQAATPMTPPAKATFEPSKIVTVKTNRGTFKFGLYMKDMPNTSRNFTELATKGFYTGVKFHRVESWVVQAGEPAKDWKGGKISPIKLETKPGLDYDKPFAVGMARTDERDSATSQFFVTKEAAPQLNGAYAAFGRVYQGMDVVRKLQQGDVIESVTLANPTGKDYAEILHLEMPRQDSRDAPAKATTPGGMPPPASDTTPAKG